MTSIVRGEKRNKTAARRQYRSDAVVRQQVAYGLFSLQFSGEINFQSLCTFSELLAIFGIAKLSRRHQVCTVMAINESNSSPIAATR